MVENLRLLRPDVVEPPSRDRVLWNGCGDPGQTKWEAWSVDRRLTCEPWSLKYYIGDFHVINLFVLDCIGECEGKLKLNKSLDELRRRRPRLLKIAIWRYPAWYTCGITLIHTAQSQACMW